MGRQGRGGGDGLAAEGGYGRRRVWLPTANETRNGSALGAARKRWVDAAAKWQGHGNSVVAVWG